MLVATAAVTLLCHTAPSCCQNKREECTIPPIKPCSNQSSVFSFKDCTKWCDSNCDISDIPINAFGVCQCSDVTGFHRKTLGMCTVPQTNVSDSCQQAMPEFSTFDFDEKSKYTYVIEYDNRICLSLFLFAASQQYGNQWSIM